MPKVKQKVSGCFRTPGGSETYCVIRSYCATMHKQGASIFESLVAAFKGSEDLRKIVPARRTDADSTTSTASRYNDAGAVLRKSYIDENIHTGTLVSLQRWWV